MSGSNLNAYKKIIKLTESPRETEARVLAQGAAKLNRCLENWEEKGTRRMLYDALIYNQKIWNIFHLELSREDNQQPIDIRKNLLTLSVFIHKQIRSAMADPSPEKLNSIININMSIAQGLGMSTDKAEKTNASPAYNHN